MNLNKTQSRTKLTKGKCYKGINIITKKNITIQSESDRRIRERHSCKRIRIANEAVVLTHAVVIHFLPLLVELLQKL